MENGFISLSRMSEKYGLVVGEILINESPLLANEEVNFAKSRLDCRTLCKKLSFIPKVLEFYFKFYAFWSKKFNERVGNKFDISAGKVTEPSMLIFF